MLVPLPYNRSVGRFAARSAGLYGRVKNSGPIDGRLSQTKSIRSGLERQEKLDSEATERIGLTEYGPRRYAAPHTPTALSFQPSSLRLPRGRMLLVMHQQVRQFVSDATNSRHRCVHGSLPVELWITPVRAGRAKLDSRTVLFSRHYIPWMDRIPSEPTSDYVKERLVSPRDTNGSLTDMIRLYTP